MLKIPALRRRKEEDLELINFKNNINNKKQSPLPVSFILFGLNLSLGLLYRKDDFSSSTISGDPH